MTHPTQEDDVKAIRDALALGPTPGPYHAPGIGEVHDSSNRVIACFSDVDPVAEDQRPSPSIDEGDRNAAFYATCTPERIARLLARLEQAEREVDAAVLAEREACSVACDSLYYAHIGPGFGEVRHGIAACAAAIRQRAAIASEAKI